MTNLREAAQMASSPCEYCGHDLPKGVDKKTRQERSYHFEKCDKRPCLAPQPEQEPNPWRFAAQRLGEDLSTVGPDGYYKMSASEWLDWAMKHITPARIEQEPVAYWHRDPNLDPEEYEGMLYFPDDKEGHCANCIPLYTTPPQREWGGLTTEDLANETDIASSSSKDIFDFRKAFWCGARWAEAKLWEKNA